MHVSLPLVFALQVPEVHQRLHQSYSTHPKPVLADILLYHHMGPTKLLKKVQYICYFCFKTMNYAHHLQVHTCIYPLLCI